MIALRALLAEVVDYAGLFPPAGLDMSAAVGHYNAYLDDPDGWMLGRFVVPAVKLDEFASALSRLDRAGQRSWRLSCLLGVDAAADLVRVQRFNDAHRERARVDSLEVRLATGDAIASAIAIGAGAGLPLFAEIPIVDDPAPLVSALAAAGFNAKVRTGGVVPEAFPAAPLVVRFMRRCIETGIAFKATAGLHHPVASRYRLTYEADAPSAAMFGYLNVFLAAAFMTNGMSDDEAVRLLGEGRPESFVIDDDSISWEGNHVDESQVRAVRARVALSFGSCSFREPVDELCAVTSRASH